MKYLIVLLLIITGCREKQPVVVTPQVNVHDVRIDSLQHLINIKDSALSSSQKNLELATAVLKSTAEQVKFLRNAYAHAKASRDTGKALNKADSLIAEYTVMEEDYAYQDSIQMEVIAQLDDKILYLTEQSAEKDLKFKQQVESTLKAMQERDRAEQKITKLEKTVHTERNWKGFWKGTAGILAIIALLSQFISL